MKKLQLGTQQVYQIKLTFDLLANVQMDETINSDRGIKTPHPVKGVLIDGNFIPLISADIMADIFDKMECAEISNIEVATIRVLLHAEELLPIFGEAYSAIVMGGLVLSFPENGEGEYEIVCNGKTYTSDTLEGFVQILQTLAK